MGIRYDITYTVKELSRVLQQPTKIAKEILERTLTYVLLRMEDFGPPGKPGGPHFTRGPTRGPTYLPGGP
jgi:hypothetical protein